MTARILVVDDVHANVRLLEARLAAEYYDVMPCFDSRSVVPLAIDWQPDAILLDVMMPDLDGTELCCLLKAEPATAHIPVIMVTALSAMPDRLHALACGADEFLTKPVETGILLARLRSVLRLKRLLDEWRARGAAACDLGLAASAPAATRAGRALLVDDLAVRADRIGDLLARNGIETARVGCEPDALAAVESGGFDLLMVSLSPVSGDPLRTVAKLRAADNTRDVPLLLLAEPDQRDLLINGLDLGASDCLLLPIDERELLLRAGNHVKRKHYQDRLRSDVGHAIRMAVTDPLTGLHNRRYLMSYLDRAAGDRTARRHAVLMIDIDHFKSINDRHGHLAGDGVIAGVAGVLRDHLRDVDLIARYGGEEFVVVAATAAERPETVAERLRAAVERWSRRGCPVTVSIGVAAANGQDSAADLLERADRALYEAKRRGRNRVVSLAACDA